MSDELEGSLFSIDTSNHFIFDLLRSKIYENPIKAICREVSCNARDANRSVGKGDIPIEITVPSHNNLSLIIKDCGPGISPYLIENIFIKYAASTKRDDNTQTGGFGLGAKTPFAYTDSFTVITVFDKIKYQYLCFIDETKKGKISLIDSHETEEQTGTTVIVPVNTKDISSFHAGVVDSVRYWDILPICNINLEKQEFILKNDNWAIADSSYYEKFNIVVDGIGYNASSYYSPILDYKKLILFFNIGEVSISPNRESIHFDDNTKNVVSDKVQKALKEIKENFISNISNKPSFIEAINEKINVNNKYNRFIGNFNCKWNDIEVPNSNSLYVYGGNVSPILYISINRKGNKNLTFSNYLSFDSNFYINDIGLTSDNLENNKKNLYKAINKNIAIIMDKEAIEKAFPLKHLNVKNLSDLLNTLAANKKERHKLSMFKFNIETGKFGRCPIKDIENDQNKKIISFLSNKNDSLFNASTLKTIASKVSIYGIDESLKDKFYKSFDDFTEITNYIKEEIILNKENIEKYIYEHKCSDLKKSRHSTNFAYYTISDKIKSGLIKDVEYINTICDYKKQLYFEYNKYYDFLYEIYIDFNNYFSDISLNIKDSLIFEAEELHEIKNTLLTLEREFLCKFPMLEMIPSYYVNENKISAITDYINKFNE